MIKVILGLCMSAAVVFGAVDINSASKSELMGIKGIGEKRAEAIIAHRKGHCFKNVDDLTVIKGIGKKFLEKNRKHLQASKCKK